MSTVRDGWTRQQQRELRAQAASAALEARQRKRPGRPSAKEAARAKHDAAYSIEDIIDIPLERVNQLMYQRRT
jgi:hypothetical protein